MSEGKKTEFKHSFLVSALLLFFSAWVLFADSDQGYNGSFTRGLLSAKTASSLEKGFLVCASCTNKQFWLFHEAEHLNGFVSNVSQTP